MNKKTLDEFSVVIDFINSKEIKTIIDVGCGQGRYLKKLIELGYEVTGVEKNQKQIMLMNEYEKYIFTPDQIAENNNKFDLVLMSHIVEHIRPEDLVTFIDAYLSKLNDNGYLLVATPTMHADFYNDYDHIKPYPPEALELLYSNYSQIQDNPRFSLSLENIWYRKRPYNLKIYPNDSTIETFFKKLTNILFKLLFTFSFGDISKKTGWVGLFTKNNQSA